MTGDGETQRPALRLVTQVGHTATFELWQSMALAEGLWFNISRGWSSATAPSTPLKGVLHRHDDADGGRMLIRVGSSLAYVQCSDGQVTACVAGLTDAAAASAMAQVSVFFPVAPPGGEGQRIPLWLWTLTPNGPRKMRRMIDVPTWEQIADNYSDDTRKSLDHLMAQRPEGGKIMLWHGPPGTGKSYALRALGYQWRAFSDIHYIVDTEELFGHHAYYLMNVLLDDGQGDLGPETKDADARWRLLILEDSGEMLAMDAKAQVGQGLSRLLNVTDGLLGQGLRVMVLVTTNEEVGQLHPAVSRSGRCAATVPFTALSAAESSAWLSRHDVTGTATTAMTVADLYATVGGYLKSEPQRRFGLVR